MRKRTKRTKRTKNLDEILVGGRLVSPPSHEGRRRRVSPLEYLSIGEHVTLDWAAYYGHGVTPHQARQRVYMLVCNANRRLAPRRFSARNVKDGETLIFRVA